jgi:hypothetical protein
MNAAGDGRPSRANAKAEMLDTFREPIRAAAARREAQEEGGNLLARPTERRPCMRWIVGCTLQPNRSIGLFGLWDLISPWFWRGWVVPPTAQSRKNGSRPERRGRRSAYLGLSTEY